MTRHYFHSAQLKFQSQIIFTPLWNSLLPSQQFFHSKQLILLHTFIVYVGLPYCCCLAINFFLYYTSTNEWCCNIIFNSPLLPSLSKHFRLIDSIVFPSFRKFVRVYLVIESLSFNFSHFLPSSTPHNMSYLAHDRGSLKNWRL